MPLPTGLSQRNGVWQLRIGVPTDLHHLYPGPDAYRGSLRTRDRSEAVTKAHALQAQYRQTFDQQRAAEAVRRAPPTVPLTPEIEAYLTAEAEWLPLVFDDVVRFTPGAVETFTPGMRFLTAHDTTAPLLTGGGPEKWDRLQRHALDEAKADLAAGRLDRIQRAADTALQGLGVRMDWTDSKARLALARIGRAKVRAYRQTLERGQGEPHDTPAKPVAPVVAADPRAVEPAKSHKLSAVFQAWREGKKRDAINKTTRALAMVEAAGITSPIEALTRQDGLKFREHINTTMASTSGKTRSDVLASVQALLNFAVKEKGWIDSNPWAGTTIAKGRAQKREPWDNETLKKLLHSPPTEDRRLDMAAQYWLPLLALMTGARQAEICQLRVDDVIQRDGVWLLDINEEGDDKSVKSAAGERWVAIHSKLIALGFIEHVERMREAGKSLVFPGILTAKSRTAALYVSDWFRARCRALGLYQKWRDFHALRTTVGTALRAVDPPLGEALITAVMGHEAGNVGAANYHRPAPKTLQRAIETLDFPAVLTLQRKP
ncbi:site-specific integrase [Variovorax atrisoli]|uniref:site-specific integrase n=1 Tax=Variovorax atrisoli TaxID=3394203 RepID=UPI003399B373